MNPFHSFKILRKHSAKENLTARNMVAQLKLDPSVKFDLLIINLKVTPYMNHQFRQINML